jgi:enoyl-CoA hydratase/carnithine racemase
LGLVSEVTPATDLMDRAMWIASTIASAPALAVQGTLRAVWMANEASRLQALKEMSTIVSLGTDFDNIAAGQKSFQSARTEWHLR